MEIIVGKNIGFCFGVERAIDIIKEALVDLNTDVFSLGPIIHNPQTNQLLTEMGLKIVESLDDIPSGTLIIRSHGLEPEIIREAEEKGLDILDVTCPLVKNVQDYARLLYEEDYDILIFGDPQHPEIKAVAGYTDNTAIVVNSKDEIKKIKKLKRVGIVIQTTQILENYRTVIFELIKMCSEFRLYNTICSATQLRQGETLELAMKVDLMVIVGGKDSANTTRLKEVAEEVGCDALHIENESELRSEWFSEINTVGVMGGASTPRWIITEVINWLNKLK